MKAYLLFAWLFAMAAASDKPRVETVAPCVLLADPIRFRGAEIETTAQIAVSFEQSELRCKGTKPMGLLGIWVDWDLDAIAKNSPEFTALAKAAQRGTRGHGGFQADVRLRGRIEVSDQFIEIKKISHRVGFGHMGAFGFRVVVLQVLDFKSNQQE